MKILNRDSLNQLNKKEIIEHIIEQISFIDNGRGYSSGVNKKILHDYPIEVLVEIALTNNMYIEEFNLNV